MKRIIAILLLSCTLLTFVSCSGDKDDETKAVTDAKTDEVTDAKTEEVTEALTEAETESVKIGFEIGKIEGDKYINNLIALAFTLLEDWRYYTEKELNITNGIKEDVTGDAYLTVVEEAPYHIDMAAIKKDGKDNVNVTIQKCLPIQIITLDMKNMCEENAKILKATYEEQGYTDVTYEIKEFILDGNKEYGIKFKMNGAGVDTYMLSVSFVKDLYLSSISICTVGEDKVEDVLSKFDRL